MHGDVTRRQVRRCRQAFLVGLVGHRLAAGFRRDRDVSRRNTGAGLIDDDQAELRLVLVRVRGVLRVQWGRGEHGKNAGRENSGKKSSHFVNVSALSAGLIL